MGFLKRKLKMEIKKITSFTCDHDKIDVGVYISRIDGDITTYDMRTRKPNMGDYMDNITMHSFEHQFATYIRNSEIADSVIYFGPMGCQTGFYLLVRNADNEKVYREILNTLGLIATHDGKVFGAKKKECGNYKNLSNSAAKAEAVRYLAALPLETPSFTYKA